MSTEHDLIHLEVQDHDAAAAKIATTGQSACCDPDQSNWGTAHYGDLRDLSDTHAEEAPE